MSCPTTKALGLSPIKIVRSTLADPRRVPFDAPWAWLAAGWRDMWTIPALSLGYGATFAACAVLLAFGLWSQGWHALIPALAGGFLLVGPLFGVGLYEASRRIGRGATVSAADMILAGNGARGQLAFFGATLMFAYLVWLQLAFLLLMLFLDTSGLPPATEFIPTLLFTSRGLGLLIAGSIGGGLIATVVFAISFVAVPILMTEQTDAVSAARASVRAVAINGKAAMLWAGLITVIMAAGFASLFVGLAIAFPLIGHATWHAYSDIYGRGGNGSVATN